VSILIVAFSHIIPALHVPGQTGVTIFFFISGFIITRLLLQEQAASGTIRLAPFYIRRFFRLTPGLLCYIAVSVAVTAALGWQIPKSDVAAVVFYAANYYDIYSKFSTHGAILSPFVITWSLAVEEHFYFIFPIILFALRKRPERLFWGLIGFIAAVTAWRVYLVYHVGLDSLPLMRVTKATDTRLDSIAYGCLLSVAFFRAANGATRVKAVLDRFRFATGAWIGIGLFVLSFAVRSTNFKEALLYSAQGIALAPLFCSLFWGAAPQWLHACLANRPMVFLGAISYSLYLYHYLALVVAQLTIRNPYGQVPAAWAMTFAGALVSYYVIEGPIRRYGSALARRRLMVVRSSAAAARIGPGVPPPA
jgi:peptidoglycan/LPS O-acetylase OafA/YrhL